MSHLHYLLRNFYPMSMSRKTNRKFWENSHDCQTQFLSGGIKILDSCRGPSSSDHVTFCYNKIMIKSRPISITTISQAVAKFFFLEPGAQKTSLTWINSGTATHWHQNVFFSLHSFIDLKIRFVHTGKLSKTTKTVLRTTVKINNLKCYVIWKKTWLKIKETFCWSAIRRRRKFSRIVAKCLKEQIKFAWRWQVSLQFLQ